MPRTVLRVKPIRLVLRVAEPEVMVQLVRLVILYEDLKLEMAGLRVPNDKEFDELSRHYREMYFVRRAFATLWEMDSAFHKLNMLEEFKGQKRHFNKARLKDWTAAVRFFSKTKKFIDSQRNAYGGHVNDAVAKYILSKVADQDDSPAAIEVRFSDDHTGHIVFKFAEQLVSHALFVDRGERDHAEYLHESWEILADAMKHAAHATQILADQYFMPLYGWGR